MSGPRVNVLPSRGLEVPGAIGEMAPADPRELASELAAHLGRERGGQLLELARTQALTSAAKPGGQSSEFRLSVLLVVAGLALAALGAYNGQPELQSQGVDLLKVVGAGYAISRGIAKAGAAAKKP